MYTDIKNIQILIALLKKHDISHLVISSGSRMKDFVFSVESDPYFTCYSVVDERSAAYFAMGVAQELNKPVGMVCTSSTATCNYLPGITEAFYQGVPLVVMTGDKDPYLLGQMEDQMIQQVNMYDRVVKKSVNLPIVTTDEDFWYCERLINEALLELNHRGSGPVHINVPVMQHSRPLTVKELPAVRAIIRISLLENHPLLQEKLCELKSAQRILVIVGQNTKIEDARPFELFFEKYNCIFYTEHMANLHIKGAFNLAVLANTIASFDELLPDIIISFGGTIGVYGLKGRLRGKKIRHWSINENGNIIDVFKSLDTIFECTPLQFFDYVTKHVDGSMKNDETYYSMWMDKYKQIQFPELPYSNVMVIKQFLEKMPENSLLHLSILNSIRVSHFFEVPPDTKVFANIGCDGIDGCMSTFLGQAVVSDRLSFLIIGDLSFFYDMNSIRIRHVKNNIRILLINNGGGGEFYIGPRPDTLDLHIAAKHEESAKGWVESVGFRYLEARTNEEFLNHVDEFVAIASDKPIFFEIFTDMKTDADAVELVHNFNKSLLNKGDIIFHIAEKVHSVVGDDNYSVVKRNIKKILKKR